MLANLGKRKRGKPARRARPRLLDLSTEEKRKRKLQYMRDWQRKNYKKRRKENKIAKKPTKLFAKKPERRCVVCLSLIGFDTASVSKRLRITPSVIRQTVYYAGFKRGRRIHSYPRFQKASTVNRMIMAQYRKDLRYQLRFDDCNYWNKHPARVAWLEELKTEKSRIISRKCYQKYYQTRLAEYLAEFRCPLCGCDGSMLSPKRRRFGIKFCSDKCNQKAELFRIQSDPELRQRKREFRKRHYYRIRREHPEVYRAEIRRKRANPLYRVAKSHRTRIQFLIKKGFMIKTQRSLKYFGCPPKFLKQHFESLFKPGMTWKNYGKVWHVDHKIPLDAFDLLKQSECVIAFNWQNIRPMFAHENQIKGNKILDGQAMLPLVIT